MEAYADFEQVLVDEIHYHCIDVPCCRTCGHGEDFDGEAVLCRVNEYYNPEMGSEAFWFGDHLGLCDKYQKKGGEGRGADDGGNIPV
jgi:hypothetical protein